MVKIPSEVKVNHRVYEIVQIPPNPDSWGTVNHNSMKIYLAEDNRTKEETLLHEIIHALDRATGRSTLKERQVDFLAIGLLGVLKDNPEVARFLLNG